MVETQQISLMHERPTEITFLRIKDKASLLQDQNLPFHTFTHIHTFTFTHSYLKFAVRRGALSRTDGMLGIIVKTGNIGARIQIRHQQLRIGSQFHHSLPLRSRRGSRRI
jgi:carotenoid cleavage dioxygenase-like enzyme